jgi:hypothetical protein
MGVWFWFVIRERGFGSGDSSVGRVIGCCLGEFAAWDVKSVESLGH